MPAAAARPGVVIRSTAAGMVVSGSKAAAAAAPATAGRDVQPHGRAAAIEGTSLRGSLGGGEGLPPGPPDKAAVRSAKPPPPSSKPAPGSASGRLLAAGLSQARTRLGSRGQSHGPPCPAAEPVLLGTAGPGGAGQGGAGQGGSGQGGAGQALAAGAAAGLRGRAGPCPEAPGWAAAAAGPTVLFSGTACGLRTAEARADDRRPF